MRIAVYAFDDITMFHLAAPLMVFGEVGRLGLAPDWQTRLWSDRKAPSTPSRDTRSARSRGRTPSTGPTSSSSPPGRSRWYRSTTG